MVVLQELDDEGEQKLLDHQSLLGIARDRREHLLQVRLALRVHTFSLVQGRNRSPPAIYV